MDALDVVDPGRVTIEKSVCDEFGISKGDFVTARLLPDGDEPKQFNATVNTKRRVTIPVRLRHDYDIEDGDEVDIEIEVGT
jgi:bifunctional DNA-binding transcriptional regulator/antitoxin component of YhaV-PrlF toxin-antitoxin module